MSGGRDRKNGKGGKGTAVAAFFGMTALVLYVLACVPAHATDPLSPSESDPVNFEADQLSHDDTAQTVTAVGHVELTQDGKILHADKMVYRLDSDTVSAIGNVSLLDEDGDVHFAEYVELTGKLKQGFVQGLKSTLADGTHLTAVEARRENGGRKMTMTEASYTPCKLCEGKEPLWQIKADKVVYDKDKEQVAYKNARLELLGVPVGYTPIFTHPDPALKRKSGFLRPSGGWTAELGTYIKGGYYWDIAPDKDMTLLVEPTTRKGVLFNPQWRQRFEKGKINIDASTARSNRVEQDGDISENKQRGHVFADGIFDLDRRWRAGFNVERTTDKEYLGLYDLSESKILESSAFAERFSGRDYSKISAMTFQDIRVGQRPEQPDLLPLAEHRMLGEPGKTFGGRWSFDTQLAGLSRNNDGQDLQKASLTGGWARQFVSRPGIVTIVEANAIGDVFSIQNRVTATPGSGLDSNATSARFMPEAQVMTSLPVTRRAPALAANLVVEPIVSVTASGNIDQNDPDVPNEDGVGIDLDAGNIFASSRFPGTDRREDKSRMAYGVRSGIYGDNGRSGSLFVGQSYRFDEDSSLFPEGSGLEDNASDLVGQMDMFLSRYFDMNYRLRVDEDNMAAKMHEVRASGGNDRFDLSTRYVFADAVGGTGFDESREQIYLGGTLHLTDEWSLTSSALTDLGEDPGLRKATLNLGYVDECFSFSLLGLRNLSNRATGEKETSVMMRFGLKNIGEISTPEIALQPSKGASAPSVVK